MKTKLLQHTNIPFYYPVILMMGLVSLVSCGGPHIHSSSQHQDHRLKSGELQSQGIAFLTPSPITGKDEAKQALAFVFTEVLAQLRPDVRRISLPETLNAVSRAGLTKEYMDMYQNYQHTGIFELNALRKIGAATKTRYVAQLKLASFEQGSTGRFGFLGVRVLQTKHANIRLFLQIWDTKQGSIAWEVTHETNYSYDTVSEMGVTFRNIVETSAKDMISKLPRHNIALHEGSAR